MTNYIIRRLLLNALVLWGVATLVFLSTAVLPGDFAAQMVASQYGLEADESVLVEARAELGLDKPIGQRYLIYMSDLGRLDFGRSWDTGRGSLEELKRRFPTTFELGVSILLVTFALSLPIGVISAVKQDTPTDYLLRGFAILGLAAPVFFVAILLTLFVLKFNLFTIDVTGRPHYWTDPLGALQLYAIPAIAGGIAGGAAIMRLLRSQMLEVMRNDYIRTARAKGLADRTIWVRHAMKNAMLPVLTVMGFAIANIFSGQIILENMFNIDGIGRYLFRRLISRDFPPFQAAVLVIAFVVVTINLIVDIGYAWLDPRVRYT